jgi:general secretion pathway protein D
VKLAIYQESSSIDESATVTSSGLITKQRSISTNVLVEDGQILALGGLMEDSTSDSVEKVTGLADIPVIGNLFKYQTAKRGKTNLMVFLRPTVIRNADQSNSVSVDRYDYMRTQIAPNKDGCRLRSCLRWKKAS